MKRSKSEVIQARIKKSESSIQAAEVLIQQALHLEAGNKIYYAAFHMVKALLATKDLDAKTHSGVKTLFSEHFVNTGLVSREYGSFFSDLEGTRSDFDYNDFVSYTEAEIKDLVSQTKEFLVEIESFIKKKLP